MINVTVCIGSSCHVKGSHKVVEELKRLISENSLNDKVTLGGTFCMGECRLGVCVKVDEEIFSVTPDTAESFFRENILARV